MFSGIIHDFIYGALMALLFTGIGFVFRRLKNGYIPPGPVGEDYSNTVLFNPLDEKEALTFLTKWNLDTGIARIIVSLFTDIYKYWGSAGDRFTIIGTASSDKSNICIAVRTPSTQKVIGENEIILAQAEHLLAGSAILRENVNGITWTIPDAHGMMQIFIINKK